MLRQRPQPCGIFAEEEQAEGILADTQVIEEALIESRNGRQGGAGDARQNDHDRGALEQKRHTVPLDAGLYDDKPPAWLQHARHLPHRRVIRTWGLAQHTPGNEWNNYLIRPRPRP